MKLPLYILIIASMTLTGCFHHKSKKDKIVKSRPIKLENVQTKTPPVIVRLPKEEPKVAPENKAIDPKTEIPTQIPPGERTEEKKSDSWWLW